MSERKVTLMYRSEFKKSSGEVLVTVTSDRQHAERCGTITRIYRSKRYVIPALTACTVPKGTAPWEISSELEPLETAAGRRLTYQVTDLGKLGELLLSWFSQGHLWDGEIIIVPESLVPKKEKSFDAGSTEAGSTGG